MALSSEQQTRGDPATYMGHVLDKVDEESQDLELKTIIKSEWSGLQLTKPEPEIFWKFIDKERKLILKE